MTLSNIKKRQVLVATNAAIVIVALGFVATRIRPHLPHYSYSDTSQERKSDALGVWHWQCGSAPELADGPHGGGARIARCMSMQGRRSKAGQLLAEMDPVDLDQRLQAQDAALSKAVSVQTAAQAQLADAKARRELAATNLNRQRNWLGRTSSALQRSRA